LVERNSSQVSSSTYTDSQGAPTPAESNAQRRQLTVMFCDLVGSTQLSSQMDPEEFRNVIVNFQHSCHQVITGFGGFIANYLGDGILIYFGYPQANEDDAERAVRAGLATVLAINSLNSTFKKNLNLSVRIGIATGEVVIGDIGSGNASQQGTVLGDIPNLAARPQGLAEPDSIIISATTKNIVGELFEVEDLGNQELKGLGNSVKAWRVVGEGNRKSRFKAMHSDHIAPITGRKEELETLLRRWRRVKNGESQIGLITGEAGIGKSRVTQELREIIRGEANFTLWHQCSRYHDNSTLFPIIRRLENAAEFSREDSHKQKLDKLEKLLSTASSDTANIA
jgi:class 3 adenylate cyclase